MDSSVTLVDPHNISLVFSPDSLKNTTVYHASSNLLDTSNPMYSISTELTDHRTEIRDARTQRLLALIERKDILPDTITFPERNEGKAMKISRWLQKSKLVDG